MPRTCSPGRPKLGLRTPISPRDLVRPVLFVPESKNAYDLLEELRTERTHFAIILDEYGSVAGLVTLEDLLEELVGPIDDEHDIPASPDPMCASSRTGVTRSMRP